MSTQRTELVRAAIHGIDEYLKTTRGRTLCGANCKVELLDDCSFSVIISDNKASPFDVHFTTVEI